jgi:tetratricopeptide (TPR) repeat protein
LCTCGWFYFEQQETIRRKRDYADAYYGLGFALESKLRASCIFPNQMPGRPALPATTAQATPSTPVIAVADEHRIYDVSDDTFYLDNVPHPLPRRPAVVAFGKLHTAFQKPGSCEAIVAAYRQAIALWPEHAQAHLRLGFILQLQGDFANALPLLRRGDELSSKANPRGHSPCPEVTDCERLIELDRKLPQLRSGVVQATGPAERIELAQFCYRYKQLYGAAAHWYEEAFAIEPGLVDRGPHRYNAACSAALAASGHGKDSADLGEAMRCHLRTQALACLRGELAFWTEHLGSGVLRARRDVVERLNSWLTDPELSGLRDNIALAQLSADEREMCLRLWADVQSLLAQVPN